MLMLKTQVLKIQSVSSKQKVEIQSKMSKTSPHHQLINTIFSRTLKKATLNENHDGKNEEKVVPVEKKASSVNQFQNVEKKVAAIVKDSRNGFTG